MIIKNAITTPDGTELISEHRHDFKLHLDKVTGKEYGVDGGHDYQRTIGDWKDCKATLVSYPGSDFELVRNAFKWGTFGKDGKSKLVYKKLSELTNSHIDAIIKTQTHLPKDAIDMFKHELKYRQEFSINIVD